jgi:hypothetical protein
MRRTFTETTRTTLLPGIRHEAPDALSRALEALWAILERPNDRTAQIAIRLLAQRGELSCPSTCGASIDLDGHARTLHAELVREEWTCGTCGDRYLITEARVC